VMKGRQIMKPYKTVLRAKVGAEINRRLVLRKGVTEEEWKELRPVCALTCCFMWRR
jgi:hypothetical protein